MKRYPNKQTGFIIVAAVVAAFVFFSFKGDERNFQLARNIDVFTSIIKELDMLYVDTINPDKTIRRGIDAMLGSLDPYTVYYPEEDRSELEQMIKGSYGGIGSLITYDVKRQRSVIAEPYEGMPAQRAGLKAGDILLEIDGRDLKGKNNSQVSEMLRGQVNTAFKLTVERLGTKEPLTFDIIRKSIELPTVPYYGVVGNNTGYINLNSFSGKPAKAFKQAFLDLKKNKGIASLVIDLRNNGGGLLEEAVEIANCFVPRGKVIVTTQGKQKQTGNTYKTQREPIDTEIPIAILVNGETASSSEILAGALQDLDRAVIVGIRTFGKGLVQTPASLPYGGTLKITTAKYYIPSGRCIQAINYNDRNEDGNAGRIPDSLTTVFHTVAGREVRDGGGISPDRIVKQERLPNILYYLVNDNLIFNYATQFCLKHPAIAPAEQFTLTDANYNDFKETVKEAGFSYDRQSEKVLKNLKETAEFEGYMEAAAEEFKALEKKLAHNLERDLDYFAKDIKRMIAYEIVKRYYYQRGSIIEQLKDDDDLREALKVLGNPEEYKSILSTASGRTSA
ncbi:MAG: S41 family peptidase [Mediterranea sp.]|jgi:carboxyl-terminal processing protease|nr:S41 family peptidase [Mediterranea sp.]